MSALAIVETAPVPAFDSWIEQGRTLAAQRRELDWQIGDWLAEGQEKFGDQLELGLLSERLGIDPKRLKQAEKVATAFPEHMRAEGVPFEVHAYIAALPADRRLPVLKQASDEHWGEREVKRVVTQHRQLTAAFIDDDPERLATEMFRCWNRMPVDVREYAWELLERAKRAGFAAINEDDVGDQNDA
ncbi:hypothetical protein [Sphingomonas xinjiangensis]|uniref:Uncharacterized protein n=1 Tax=Sphingomonas xinjiangensis TaxID=643568 RepID=A0A840YNX3_9SPHN|nr:hypothetical protein [Sphingomonas xinjiangensis]MBB5709322.1 hypothetical protein [Sphingomonas xinjiangensis]